MTTIESSSKGQRTRLAVAGLILAILAVVMVAVCSQKSDHSSREIYASLLEGSAEVSHSEPIGSASANLARKAVLSSKVAEKEVKLVEKFDE